MLPVCQGVLVVELRAFEEELKQTRIPPNRTTSPSDFKDEGLPDELTLPILIEHMTLIPAIAKNLTEVGSGEVLTSTD